MIIDRFDKPSSDQMLLGSAGSSRVIRVHISGKNVDNDSVSSAPVAVKIMEVTQPLQPDVADPA